MNLASMYLLAVISMLRGFHKTKYLPSVKKLNKEFVLLFQNVHVMLVSVYVPVGMSTKSNMEFLINITSYIVLIFLDFKDFKNVLFRKDINN